MDLRLYLVTDTEQCGRRRLVDTVAAAVVGGVTLVQLRDPRASGRELYRAAAALLAVLGPVPLIINDRLDVALSVGAAGVHLGQSDLPWVRARAVAGPGFVIGASAGSAAEVDAVATLPPGTVDYLGIGPVFATATKPDAGPPLGPAAVAALAARVPIPTVAIGGLSGANAAAVPGVDGICVVSAICRAADPQRAAHELRKVRE